MELEWDEDKRRQVLDKHKIDILDAALIFEGQTVTRRDPREYGEERWISTGMVDGECYVVVHTERGTATRIITAWKGGRYERREYQEGVSRRDPTDEGSR